MRVFLTVFILGLLMASGAEAQTTSYVRGIDLLSICRVQSKDTTFCESYVAGIIDYHNLMRNFKSEPPIKFCIPERYTLTQVTEIVLNDLAKSPQHDHFIAAPAVALALFKSFPCKTRKK